MVSQAKKEKISLFVAALKYKAARATAGTLGTGWSWITSPWQGRLGWG
jgi:hypothetical protein